MEVYSNEHDRLLLLADDPERELVLKELIRHDEEGLKALLEEHPNLANCEVESNIPWEVTISVLHYAVQANKARAVEVLLEFGADMEAKTELYGWTPLQLAAWDNKGMSEPLLAAGAKIDIHSTAGLAFNRKMSKMLEETDVNQLGPCGTTPLHFAGTRETAELLLKRGADLEAKDCYHGATPIWWALGGKYYAHDVVDLLLEQGCRIDDIFLAAALGDERIVRNFLVQDAGLANARTPKLHIIAGGATPIHIAYFYGSEAAAKTLIEFGADRNASDAAFGGKPCAWGHAGGHLRTVILNMPCKIPGGT